MKTQRRWIWALLLLVPVVALAGFAIWAHTPSAPLPEALAALESDAQVAVERTEPGWLFRPLGQEPQVGLIFYPGGRVDPRAYAPAAHAVAAEGYLVVIVPMPFNLAVLAPGRAAAVMDAFPEVARWAIGGHSLGGAMAAHFAWLHPDDVQAMALWASYPAEGDDLSSRSLDVVSVYGTRDGLTTLDDIEASRRLLPPDTQWVAVEGGNHAQFGWYGPQGGDNEATLGRPAQQAQAVGATLELLSRLADSAP